MSPKIDWTTIDTGWVDCTYDSNWQATSDADRSKLQVRRIYNMVFLKGLVKPKTATSSSATDITVGYVPEGFRPIYPVVLMQGGQYSTRFRLEIADSNGRISFWYRQQENSSGTMVANKSFPTSYWNSCDASWVIN